jgi:hypothetical protein
MRNGAHENYSFKEENGVTSVDVEIDMTEEFADYMNDARPKGIGKIERDLRSGINIYYK